MLVLGYLVTHLASEVSSKQPLLSYLSLFCYNPFLAGVTWEMCLRDLTLKYVSRVFFYWAVTSRPGEPQPSFCPRIIPS